MPLKTKLDADQFGELDETARQFYQEGEDGTYVLDVEGIDDHPTVQSLKSGHQRSKKEREEAKKQADGLKKRFGPLVEVEDLDLSGVDPERVTEVLPYLRGEQDLPKAEGGSGGKTPEELEKVRANARKPLERDLENAKGEADKWKSLAQRTLVHNNLSAEFARAGVQDPDFLELLIERFSPKCRIEFEEDKASVLMDSEYGEVSPKEFVKEWANTDYAKKFIGAPNNSGGGAGGGGGGPKVKNPWSDDNWNMTEQARIYREDPERAKRMAAEHGKKVGAR